MKARFEELRRRFENREAIFIEKGAMRVHVGKIDLVPGEPIVKAALKEIPTPGLPTGFLALGNKEDPLPSDPPWEVGAGYLTRFTTDSWSRGYGGWSLYFGEERVREVVSMAAACADDAATRGALYRAILMHLQQPGPTQTVHRVFPEEEHRTEGPL